MQKLSRLIYWCCNLVLFVGPLLVIWSVIDTPVFADLIKRSMHVPIQWGTVQASQWIAIWVLVMAFFSIGYMGIYFLKKSFQSFAAGEWFNLSNSLNIRKFAKLLLLQSILTPVLFTVSVIVLSLNHPEGQKMIAFSFGPTEIKGVFVALIFLIISHILVLGHNIDEENKQFL